LATLFLELEFAIFLGVILSLVLYLNRTSRPRVVARVPNPADPKRAFTSDPALPECPQLKIVRVDGSLFYGAVSHVQECFSLFEARHPEQRHLTIVASGINFIDVAGAELLAQEAKQRQARGGSLTLIGAKDGVRRPLRRGGYLQDIGEGNLYQSKTEAINALVSKLDPARCRTCSARIFRECQAAALAAPVPAPA
jgi:SulP family sulfate permease